MVFTSCVLSFVGVDALYLTDEFELLLITVEMMSDDAVIILGTAQNIVKNRMAIKLTLFNILFFFLYLFVLINIPLYLLFVFVSK